MKEENTLTAKEWLKKEIGTISELSNPLPLMEKYANYKNRILEDRIKEFAQFVKINCDSYTERMYNKHFNIQTIKECKHGDIHNRV